MNPCGGGFNFEKSSPGLQSCGWTHAIRDVQRVHVGRRSSRYIPGHGKTAGHGCVPDHNHMRSIICIPMSHEVCCRCFVPRMPCITCSVCALGACRKHSAGSGCRSRPRGFRGAAPAPRSGTSKAPLGRPWARHGRRCRGAARAPLGCHFGALGALCTPRRPP